MNDTDEIVDQTLSILRRKPIDAYEVYLEQSSHFYVESKNGKVDTFQTSRLLGMAFRILNRQRMGFSYTTSANPSQSFREDAPEGVERIIVQNLPSQILALTLSLFSKISLLVSPFSMKH
jgi:predicted Zn-dependent protease